MSRYGYRTTNEKVGAVVLLPVKLAVVLLVLAAIVLAYPFMGVYVLVAGEGPMMERVKRAATWPLGILAMNDFMSLGGMDNPTLSKISAGINKVWAKLTP